MFERFSMNVANRSLRALQSPDEAARLVPTPIVSQRDKSGALAWSFGGAHRGRGRGRYGFRHERSRRRRPFAFSDSTPGPLAR